MASKVKLIAIDLDGTLLRSDRSVGPRSVAALRAAHTQGVEIVLASGRMTPAMERAVDALGLDLYIASYNGAVLSGRRADGRQRIFHLPLNRGVARELYAHAQQHRLQVNYYLDDVVVSEDGPHLRPYINIYRERTSSPYQFVQSLEPYLDREPTKLLMVMEPQARNAAAEYWKVKLGERAAVVCTDPEYVEFLNPAANKGAAIACIATKLGITHDAILAVGDGENDVSMLRLAGWPVAVANAGDKCRAAAKYFTQQDHENDAVAEAVERWVLS